MEIFPTSSLPRVLKHALSRGGDFSEVFFEDAVSSLINIEDQRVEVARVGLDRGAGIRVIHNLHTAYGYTNDLSERGLMELAGAVASAARGEPANEEIVLTSAVPPVTHSVELCPTSIDLADKVRRCQSADRTARDLDPRISQVQVSFGDNVRSLVVANSEGVLARDRRTGVVLIVRAVAEQEGLIQSAREAVGGAQGLEFFDRHSPDEVARTAASRALLMLSAKPAPGGRMPVVLSSEAGGTMIHEAVGHGLEADLANEGLSVYQGKIGELIASPLVTVLDDGTLPGKRGSFAFDDEGNQAKKNVLIEGGVLKRFMHNRLSCMKDSGASPTGNGRRESYRHRPQVRMTNTFIAPGEHDPEEILSSTTEGLFVRKMGGGQVNTVNGDFVFGVGEGYLIENGSLGEPVRGATLSGNGPAVLEEIDRVGSDLGFAIGTCGKGGQGVPVSDAQPTIRIPSLVVGGAQG